LLLSWKNLSLINRPAAIVTHPENATIADTPSVYPFSPGHVFLIRLILSSVLSIGVWDADAYQAHTGNAEVARRFQLLGVTQWGSRGQPERRAASSRTPLIQIR
jgi:hypothetical protein